MAATSGEQDTERAIGTKLIAAGDARTAVLRRVYPASLETLWQAITDRTHLRRWFIEPRGDLRFGGTFALEGHAHGRSVLQPTPEDRQLMAASARAWQELLGAPD